MIERSYIPVKPFDDFKWQWACFAPTESINDPVVLLGVLFRMEKLEGRYKYSSPEFHAELESLSSDIKDSIGVNLAGRGGERNLIRNSGQYWRALNLIPKESRGTIRLTDYGRKVASHEISQTEFSALTIMTLRLPNAQIQSDAVCEQWRSSGISIYPLKLILSICREAGYLTPDELCKIVIPLSANPACTIADYAGFLERYRKGTLDISRWPDCCPRSNDRRMAREFLLFLSNYGYLTVGHEGSNATERYQLNKDIDNEIMAIVSGITTTPTIDEALQLLNQTDVIADVERKRMQASRRRPNQARFRREVLNACQRCIITNVSMPEVLEAAHIKPYKYNGADVAANGFAMRLDIHMLFDTGHLRIDPEGNVFTSPRLRYDYGALIPPRIVIPDHIDREFLRWRWENYNGM